METEEKINFNDRPLNQKALIQGVTFAVTLVVGHFVTKGMTNVVDNHLTQTNATEA